MLGIRELLNRSPTHGKSQSDTETRPNSFEKYSPVPLKHETPETLNAETGLKPETADKGSSSELSSENQAESPETPESSEASELSDSGKLASKVESGPGLKINTQGRRVSKLHRSRIHPHALQKVRLIDIALRRKSSVKRVSNPDTCGLKLHRKFLEAGLRVRLVLCPSIYDIFCQLTPATSRSPVFFSVGFNDRTAELEPHDLSVELLRARGAQDSPKKRDKFLEETHEAERVKREGSDEIQVKEEASPSATESLLPVLQSGKIDTRVVRLIDNNLVDLAGVPSKVLKSLRYDQNIHSPLDLVGTFNCLDTAVLSVFNVQNYSLVRVTKSASTNQEPSVLVKLETAHPGDPSLIDDGEYIEDMVTSLGRPHTLPSNLFLKKVVARPRYKVDMKLYFVPCAESMSLYVDLRILERDLINGVVDLNLDPERMLFTTFDPQPVLSRVLQLIQESDRHIHLHPADHPMLARHVPNHITDNLQLYMFRTQYADLEDYSSASSLNSRSSLFSRASSSGSTSLGYSADKSA